MKAFVASLVLALVPLAAATPRPPIAPCPSPYAAFESIGCYDDAASDALVHRSLADQNQMTIEKCTAECKSNGFRFAGLKYYGVCYCGSALLAPKIEASQCYQPCTGNSAQICGSDHTLSVYEDPTFVKDIAEVSADDYEPLGCYNDDPALGVGRALLYQVDVPADTFTTNTCIDACRKKGFAFAGTEYGRECWCGTNVGPDNVKVEDGECGMPCLGDDSEVCGDSNRINLYYAKELDSDQPCGYTPPTTTLPPVTTTAAATTTAPICTVTETEVPECEFKCGKWCAPALPEWKNKAECVAAAKTCALQLTSCFKTAGWPGVEQCFEFGKWCIQVGQFCSGSSECASSSTGKCNKKGCWNKYKPINVKPPTTTTKTTACPTTMVATTTTAAQTTSTACPPEPTNICKQPTSDRWGYGPDRPVAGIPLPLVGCNDIKSDFTRNPFKFYTDADSRKCHSFSWNQRPNVCADACEEQYDECKDTYVRGCDRRRSVLEVDAGLESRDALEERTYSRDECAAWDSKSEWWRKGSDLIKCWGKGANTHNAAGSRCKAQYIDCLAVNKKVNPGDACKKWCER